MFLFLNLFLAVVVTAQAVLSEEQKEDIRKKAIAKAKGKKRNKHE